ncbi:acyl-CoA dehydrogenase family protein [Microbispora sp. NPDC049125]|uniref:acyl-CoA dehydrogenase family protein n=1 Tax=Microbispora sp. NPDC049125 TaxID=3154929 RepID=UPI0034653920
MGELSERDRRWAAVMEAARDLAPVFERRSLEHYDEGGFAAENIADLVAAGVTAINVPAALGGIEATLAENVELLKTVAAGCGSTAFALSIHTVITASLRDQTGGPWHEKLMRAVADGAFVIGPFTDESSGSNWTRPSTTARRDGDGFVLDGLKHFATGFDAATHLIVTAAVADGILEPPFDLSAFVVETAAAGDGLRVERPWRGGALTMTGSHSLRLDGLRVDGDAQLFPDGLAPLFVMSRQQWGHYCFAAVFLGLAERAYELAVETTKGRSNTAVRDVGRLPGVQFAIARMRARLATMNALLTAYATEHVEPGEDLLGFVADTCVPKYFVTAEAEAVVSAAFEVIGGSAIRDGSRIAQIWRDVKAGPLLPFTADQAREFIGKQAFGISPIETPRWM